MTHLLPQHAAMLKASAICPEVAEARGYRSITKLADLGRLGFAATQQQVPTLLIPLHKVSGGVGLYHHRPDQPRIKGERIVKYEFPAGQRMIIDVHPFIKDKVRDPSIPLFITEGAKKADAAVGLGLCCAAVVGTFNFRGTNEFGGKTTLPDWEGIALKDQSDHGRQVYVCYDSDVMLKPQVFLALNRLAEFLKSRGAKVAFIYLPAGDGAGKVGLDDFIAAGHGVDDLLTLSTPELRQPPAEEPRAKCPYLETDHGLSRLKPTESGPIEVPLTNFTARIVAVISEDDGVDSNRFYRLEARFQGRTYTLNVPATEFGFMNWVANGLPPQAACFPGVGAKDHARFAIQTLSTDVQDSEVFLHTGWRQIGDSWRYLHGGVMTLDEADETGGGVAVRLPGALQFFVLPAAPTGAELIDAVRASLDLLNLGPLPLTAPVLAAVYRSVLGLVDFSLHVAGETGVFKSELAALAQQHFGAGLNARHLPANWSSTDNFLEGLAFQVKDAVLVIDEMVPTGSAVDRQRLWAKADRVLRAQGNNSGRGRMRANGTIPPPKPPRGLIISTGEDIPPGHSLGARVLMLEVGPGDIPVDRLSICQQHATNGVYAQCLAGYVQWLSSRYEAVSNGLRSEVETCRDRLSQAGQHRRTPAMVAELVVGFEHFLRFAVEIGALTQVEADTLLERVAEAITAAADRQTHLQLNSEPVRRYLEILSSAIASGRAHLANTHGTAPESPEMWGWRDDTGSGVDWKSMGERIGWVDGDSVYLNADAAYATAGRLATDAGMPLTLTPTMLHKRLADKKLLCSVDEKRHTLLVRKTVEGSRLSVLHLHVRSLTRGGADQTDHSDPNDSDALESSTDNGSSGRFPWSGLSPMNEEPDHEIRPVRPAPSHEQEENGHIGRVGRSLTTQEATVTREDGHAREVVTL